MISLQIDLLRDRSRLLPRGRVRDILDRDPVPDREIRRAVDNVVLPVRLVCIAQALCTGYRVLDDRETVGTGQGLRSSV